MQTEPMVYWNGERIPFSQANLPLYDGGVVYGAMVTDRLRTYNQKLFRLEDHLSRFQLSCQSASIPLRIPLSELREITQELLSKNRIGLPEVIEWAILFLATPGPIAAFSPTPVENSPTLGVLLSPVNFSHYRTLFLEGAKCDFNPAILPPELISPSIKHRSRLHWWIAEQRHRSENSDAKSTLLYTTRDTDPKVRETATANFLAVIDGVVISPPRSMILTGVSLGVIEMICRQIELPFLEREITQSEVENEASEALLCNSTFGVAPIRQIATKIFPTTHLVFEQLLHAYSEIVGVPIREQFIGMVAGS